MSKRYIGLGLKAIEYITFVLIIKMLPSAWLSKKGLRSSRGNLSSTRGLLVVNQRVLGSSPSGGAQKKPRLVRGFLFVGGGVSGSLSTSL